MGVEIMAPPGMEEMTNQLQSMFQSLGSDKTKKRKMKIKDALKTLIDDEAVKLINPEELKQKPLMRLSKMVSCLLMRSIRSVKRRIQWCGCLT